MTFFVKRLFEPASSYVRDQDVITQPIRYGQQTGSLI